MKKLISLFIAFFILCFDGYSQIILEKISLLDNKVTILAPKSFTKMTEEMLAIKYPAGANKPQWVLTDEDGTVNLAYNYTNSAIDDNGIPAFTDQMLAVLKTNREDIKFIDDGILLKEGKNIGYIKFISQAKDQKVFNYMFYISLDNRLLLFSFNCIEKLRKKWEVKADEMAASLRLLNL